MNRNILFLIWLSSNFGFLHVCCGMVQSIKDFALRNSVDLIEHIAINKTIQPVVEKNIEVSNGSVSLSNSNLVKKIFYGFLPPTTIFIVEKTARIGSIWVLGKEQFLEKVAFDYSCLVIGKMLEIFSFGIANIANGTAVDILNQEIRDRIAERNQKLLNEGDHSDMDFQKRCYDQAKSEIEDRYKKHLLSVQSKKKRAEQLLFPMGWLSYILQQGNSYSTKTFYNFSESKTLFGKIFYSKHTGIKECSKEFSFKIKEKKWVSRDDLSIFIKKIQSSVVTSGVALFVDIAGEYKGEYDKLPEQKKIIDLIKIGIFPGLKVIFIVGGPCSKIMLYWLLKNKFHLYAWPKIQSTASMVMKLGKDLLIRLKDKNYLLKQFTDI